jgi:endonuclease/exonuclease/phosphatase family metal-dependent hydrolase
VLDLDRIARYIVAMNPNLVSLNEVDDQASADTIQMLVERYTGQAWTSIFSGRGNQVLTRLGAQSGSVCAYNASAGRIAAHLGAYAGGRVVHLWSTHLSVDSSGERAAEVLAMQACAAQYGEARVIAGDFNMQASSGEYALAAASYIDAWPLAKALGTAINFPGNCDGCTRNSRIDYVFASQGAPWLSLQSAEIVDTRDGYGYMPSDHKPLIVVYEVR